MGNPLKIIEVYSSTSKYVIFTKNLRPMVMGWYFNNIKGVENLEKRIIMKFQSKQNYVNIFGFFYGSKQIAKTLKRHKKVNWSAFKKIKFNQLHWVSNQIYLSTNDLFRTSLELWSKDISRIRCVAVSDTRRCPTLVRHVLKKSNKYRKSQTNVLQKDNYFLLFDIL